MLILVSVILCLLGTTHGETFIFLYPANLYGINDVIICPTPTLLTRVCNVFTDKPCFCGTTFAPQAFYNYEVADYICQPPPEALMFRVRIKDDAMSHKNLEQRLLMVFGTSFLNNSRYETDVKKIAETVKIISARCVNRTYPYVEVVFSIPGSYKSVNMSNPVQNVLTNLGYNIFAILRNTNLSIVRIRLLKKFAMPSIFEPYYIVTKKAPTHIVKERTFPRPVYRPHPINFYLGLGVIITGSVSLAVLLLNCYRVYREQRHLKGQHDFNFKRL